jgi:hypothetical protein
MTDNEILKRYGCEDLWEAFHASRDPEARGWFAGRMACRMQGAELEAEGLFDSVWVQLGVPLDWDALDHLRTIRAVAAAYENGYVAQAAAEIEARQEGRTA